GNARSLHPKAFEQRSWWKGDVELTAMQLRVARTPQQDTSRECAVATGTPGFLVIRLGGGWQGPMDDEANVGLVNAHAESAGSNDDVDPIVEKCLQCFRTAPLGETSMVWGRTVSGTRQRPSNRFRQATSRSIHDDHVIIARQQVQEGSKAIGLGRHPDDP